MCYILGQRKGTRNAKNVIHVSVRRKVLQIYTGWISNKNIRIIHLEKELIKNTLFHFFSSLPFKHFFSKIPRLNFFCKHFAYQLWVLFKDTLYTYTIYRCMGMYRCNPIQTRLFNWRDSPLTIWKYTNCKNELWAIKSRNLSQRVHKSLRLKVIRIVTNKKDSPGSKFYLERSHSAITF